MSENENMPIASSLLSPLTPTTSRGALDSAFPLCKQTPTPTPTHAKITSLSHWTLFFSPFNGIFRLPSLAGSSIEHLEIDIRFVEPVKDALKGKIHLPRVCKVTLRGGEFCLDDASEEGRAAALTEVLEALRPVEVNCCEDLNKLTSAEHSHALTFSTHLVHRSIVSLGSLWSSPEHGGNLRKLTIQGGYPIPNLTAPTPQITPFSTPLPSPSVSSMGMPCYFSGLPSLSSTKPSTAAPAPEEKREKKRLAQYSLKPRFAYAFEAWHAEELRWSFEGNYTNPCILTAVSHLLKHIDSLIASGDTASLPSALTLFPLSESILPSLRDLPESLELSEDTKSYLADVVFVSLDDSANTLSRIFTVEEECSNPTRMLKADMLVLSSPSIEIIDHTLPSLSATTSPESNVGMLTPGNASNAANSPAMSASALEDDGDERLHPHDIKGDQLGLNVQGLQIS